MTSHRCFVGLAALAVFCAGAAVAQEGARAGAAGVEPPARSFLLDDGATAVTGNPAGLGFLGGPELDFVHEGGTGLSGLSANGLFLGLGGAGAAVGGGLEWIDPQGSCDAAAPCTRRLSLGAAVHGGWLSLGAGWHRLSTGSSPALQGLQSWDVGAIARPFEAFSLGFAALDVNQPSASPVLVVPRRYVASLGVRPAQEWLDLAADAIVRECPGGGDASALPCGAGHPDLRFTADLRVLSGLALVAQLAYGAQAERWSGQIGFQLDAAHLGLRAAHGFDGDAGRNALALRLSKQTLPSVGASGFGAVEIDLDKALSRPPRDRLLDFVFPGARPDPFLQTLALLQRLACDPRVQAVVLRTLSLPIGLGEAEELRSHIEELRSAGKKVIFYLESAGDLEYYVASSADRVYAPPQAVLAVNGFSATAVFAAAGLDKLGVKAEFFRVGAYKNAPDLFTRSELSSEQREVQEALLDDVYGRYTRAVIDRRGVSDVNLKVLLDQGLLKPEEAVKAKLLDGLLYADQLGEEVGKLFGVHTVQLRKTGAEPPDAKDTRWGGRDRIGVVRVEGDIAPVSGGDPFGAVHLSDAHRIARRIHALADDPGIAAIVVRIDSPGGDGNSSDLIWRELVRARTEKHKPVVASLGNVAASGGYYVAVAADEIVAEPSTVTGSIGVFVGHFDASALYGKLGLAFGTTRRGESADLFSTTRSLTDRERAMLQGWVDGFYAQFLSRVAEGRHLGKDAVDKLARGRVWSGLQAKERGLVDTLGGFTDALERAKARAGIARDAEVVLDDAGEQDPDPLQAAFSGALLRTLDEAPALGTLARGEAARALRALSALGAPGTLRARMPYEFDLH